MSRGYPTAGIDGWRRPEVLNAAVDHLLYRFATDHPDAYQLADSAPWDALKNIPNLTVLSDATARTPTCPIDGTYDADTTTIRYRSMGEGRDRFTLLHELGHHLLAQDEAWCYETRPALKTEGQRIEELVCSTFAAHLLIPDVVAAAAFTNGVTAAAVRDLNATTYASASACLTRALTKPGNRLVMLTDLEGRIYYAQSNGEPFAPSRRTPQPEVAALIIRAQTTDEQRVARAGGQGILYSTGTTNTDVRFDVAVNGGLAFVIVEPTVVDTRLDQRADRAEWDITCVAGCGESFPRSESPRTCNTCGEPVCPRCNGCECPRTVACTVCWLALPTARANAGYTVHEECE